MCVPMYQQKKLIINKIELTWAHIIVATWKNIAYCLEITAYYLQNEALDWWLTGNSGESATHSL